MRLITRKQRAKAAPKRWEEQYRGQADSAWNKCATKTKELLALTPRQCTPERVNTIIGNQSWTSVKCYCCDQEVEAAVKMSEVEGHSVEFCFPCLEAALRLKEKLK